MPLVFDAACGSLPSAAAKEIPNPIHQQSGQEEFAATA